MSLTPSAKSSFIAGIGLWVLLWASLFKSDEIANAAGVGRWFSSERCLNWVRRNKSASLLGTEVFNYGTHGISDQLGVTFALGGTVVNLLVIYVLLPIRSLLKRN
jgi:hypothetical protein